MTAVRRGPEFRSRRRSRSRSGREGEDARPCSPCWRPNVQAPRHAGPLVRPRFMAGLRLASRARARHPSALVMRSVTIRNTSLATSPLGFGCATLTSLNDRARAVALLREAHDLGIAHFDVARAYGLGHAEGILGEFLQGRRGAVTVTTKFGLQPPSGGVAGAVAGNQRLVGVAKAVLRRVPGLAAIARRRAQTMIAGGAFTAAEAERSLATSLRELRTDYVDLLLLHECTLD